MLWADTSVVFITNNLEPLLTIAQTTSLFGTLIDFGGHLNHKCQTNSKMFNYFNVKEPDVIGSLNQMEAGNVLYYRNFLNALIMKAWVSCALDNECMAKGSLHSLCCSEVGCHRFDQSALTTIISFFLQYPKSKLLRTAHAIHSRIHYYISRPQDSSFLEV